MLVALGAGRPDGRASRGIEEAELDSDGVGDLAHDAAQGVDFANQVAFGDPSDGGVTGHLRDQVDVECEERGLQAHAGGGHRGLASGVASADYYYIEMFVEWHWCCAETRNRGGKILLLIVTRSPGESLS